MTKKMRKERLEWCLQHKDWTLEDWRNVIWSDETAVVLLHRRGRYRIWRKADEATVKKCIRERWKGYSEFMFWGCLLMIREDLVIAGLLRQSKRRKKLQIRLRS